MQLVKVLLAVPKNTHDYLTVAHCLHHAACTEHQIFDSHDLFTGWMSCINMYVCCMYSLFYLFFPPANALWKSNFSTRVELNALFNIHIEWRRQLGHDWKNNEHSGFPIAVSFAPIARTSGISLSIWLLSKFNLIIADNVSHNKSYVYARRTVLHQLFNVKYALVQRIHIRRIRVVL